MLNQLDKFIKQTRKDIASGALRTTKPLTDYDIAVMYCVARLYDMGATTVTAEQIWHILAAIAPELAEEEA